MKEWKLKVAQRKEEKNKVLGWEWMKEGKLKVAQRNEKENKMCWDENEWKKESWV